MAKRTRTSTSEKRRAISRRKFLAGVVGSAAVGATLPVSSPVDSALMNPGTPAESFRVLTVADERLLTAILNQLIPANGVMPAAGDLGLSRFIDGVMADAPHLRRSIDAVLSKLRRRDADAGLSGAAGRRALREIQRDQTAAFNDLLRSTYTGYYGHPRVIAALGWNVPESHEPFDATSLDAVRSRGPIYRNV